MLFKVIGRSLIRYWVVIFFEYFIWGYMLNSKVIYVFWGKGMIGLEIFVMIMCDIKFNFFFYKLLYNIFFWLFFLDLW